MLLLLGLFEQFVVVKKSLLNLKLKIFLIPEYSSYIINHDLLYSDFVACLAKNVKNRLLNLYRNSCKYIFTVM